MRADRPFVVYAPGFKETSGGRIALHRLVDVLNRTGHRALLWPARRPLWNDARPVASLAAAGRWQWRQWHRPFRTHPSFAAPLATAADLADAVVVYPETVRGNPLRSTRVVRWLLHRPGFHRGHVEYGAHDRYFFFGKAFDDPQLNPHGGDNLLRVVWVRDDLYHPPEVETPRQGTAVLWRKGRGRTPVHEARDAVVVDGLSHAEMATVFRRVQTCVSYDPYTMYSLYAALCGCDSVVVPEPGLEKTDWRPAEAERYGIAYGFDDLAWARATRPLVLQHLKALESASNATARQFVDRCRVYFP